METKRNLLVVSSKKTVKLVRQLNKINFCAPAFGDTMVLLGQEKRGKDNVTLLIHVSQKGDFLFERPYQWTFQNVGMLNDHKVIALDASDDMIEIIDLKTHQILQINHEFKEFWTKAIGIEVFSQSRTFCIRENKGWGKNHLKLSYYQEDGLEKDSQPLVDWTAGQDEWNFHCALNKINNHSKMGWWDKKIQLQVLFHFFDLRADPKGKLSIIKISYGSKIMLRISNLWQIKSDKYMIVAESNKGMQEQFSCQINDNYILEAYEGIDKPTIRETKFLFKQDQQNPHQYSFSACFGFNSYSVFHTKRELFEDESPVFYVDNETEEVVFTETWKSPECITYFNNFFPCWNGSSFTRAEYDDKKFEEVTLESKEIMDLSNQYLQFLLHLNEDFDDDLLQDAISLLIDL